MESGLEPEPVSPELVLVDPQLARRERARLVERARLEAMVGDIATLRRVVDRQPAPEETTLRRPGWRHVGAFSRRRLLPAALMWSLFVNGILVADLLTRTDGEASGQKAPVAVRMVTVQRSSPDPTRAAPLPAAEPSTSVVPPTLAAPPTWGAPSRSRAAATAARPSKRLQVTKALVERRLVSLIIAAPARKLPRQFVDGTTGLVKNNVQVVCRRRTARSFLCVVRLPSHAPREGLYVRYRPGPNGRGVFTWYGYKHWRASASRRPRPQFRR